MKIKTLKDMKEALNGIPIEVLEDFGVHFGEEPYTQLLYFGPGEEPQEEYYKLIKKYPALEKIDNWITNISRITLKQERNAETEEIDEAEGIENCIGSEDKIEVPEYKEN